MKHFRKVSAVLLAVLMVAVILPSTGLLTPATEAAEVGAIVNGDFSQTETLEHASGGSWVHALYWEQYEWGATVTSGAVKFTKDSSTAGHVSLSQVVAVNTNATYTLSFDVKGGTGGCNTATTPCITYKVLGGTRGDACNVTLNSGTPQTNSSSYKSNSYTVTTTSYKYIEIQFISTGTGDNDSYLDNVKLTVVNAGDTGTHAKPSFVDFGNELNRPKNSSSNAVTQPSFEDTTNAPWNVSTFIDNKNLSVINHSDAKDGSKVLYYSNKSTTGTWHTFELDLPSGGNYVLSAWVKFPYLSASAQGKASIGLIDPDTNKFFMSGLANYKGHTSTPFLQIRPTATDNQWHLRSITFFVGAAGTVKIGVYGEQSELYIDDISVHLVENGVTYTGNQTGTISPSTNSSNLYCTHENNLITDANMGPNAEKFWKDKASGWNNGFMSFENQAMKFTGTGASGKQVYSYIKWIYVNPGTKYTVSYDYRITAKGSGQLRFLDNNVDLPKVFYTRSFSTANSDWKTESFTFNSGNYNRIAVMFTDGTGTALFDDFRIFETANGISTEPEEAVYPTLKPTHPDKGVSKMEMTDSKLGLAFKFDLEATGWTCNEVAERFKDGRYKIDYSTGKVDAFEDGKSWKLIEAGAVMTNKQAVGQDANTFTLDNLQTDKTVIQVKADKAWNPASTSPNLLTYAVRIVNIPLAHEETLIYARPYYIFEYNGRQITVYGDIQFDSYKAQKDVNDGWLEWD